MNRATSGRLLTAVAAVAVIQCGALNMRAQDGHFEESIRVRGTTYPGMGDYALTFSAPMALPGLSLLPGTYEFHNPGGHVVQVPTGEGRLRSIFSTIST